MPYFRERNKLNNEYSGYQEVSDGLRDRLIAICRHYIAEGSIGVGQEGFWIPKSTLNHAVKLRLNKDDIYQALRGTYDEVFEAIELFLAVAIEKTSRKFEQIFLEIEQAFYIAGSVYQVDKNFNVVLRAEEKFVKNIDYAAEALLTSRNGKEVFLSAVNDFISRKGAISNVVKEVFIAFEDYLKTQTKANDYGNAIQKLEKQKIISATQKALLAKIYAYGSDSYGVRHAGNSEKPDEIDALWFIETVTAQLLFIDRKLKQQKVE